MIIGQKGAKAVRLRWIRANRSSVCCLYLIPRFLDLDAAAQFLQHKLPGVMVDDEHTVLLIRPLVSFKNRHGRRGALRGERFISVNE